MVNEKIIRNWGIPELLKDKNLEFIFDTDDLSYDLKNDKIINGLTCDSVGSKFCLCDIKNKKIILTMDFLILGKSELIPWERETEIKLRCLCLNDTGMRNKGISTYYIEKLIKFGLSNNIKIFKLYPNPDDELFDNLDKNNILSIDELKRFYISRFEKFGFNHTYLLDEDGKESQLIFKKL